MKFLKLLFLLALSSVASAQTAKPNIVVIMTDDQRVDDTRVMTKTKALIGSGTVFTNAYVNYPLCCPSRASFLTGQYPHNHHVEANKAPNGGYGKLDHANTLPVWLQAAGYYTAHIGKYLNEYGQVGPLVPPGWTDWQASVHGFENYNYTLIDNGVRVAYGSAPQDYLTDVIAARSVEAISDASVSGQPFFVSIAPLAPHKETHAGFAGFPNPRPAPRHLEAYQNSTEQVPRSPNFNEADVADKPSFIRQRPLITSEAGIQSRMRSRLTSLLAVDELVQKVVEALAVNSELDNTVLIFTSDNGFFQGEHRIGTSKFEWHKPSSQVPLWIKGPGFPDGAVVSQDVANTDLAPTIAALAGATPGLEVDGTSLVPILQGVTHPDILIEGPDYDAVVTPDFGYILYGNGEEELYDYREDTVNYDPYQLVSRHNAAAYATIRSQLSEKLARLKTCIGLSCRQ